MKFLFLACPPTLCLLLATTLSGAAFGQDGPETSPTEATAFSVESADGNEAESGIQDEKSSPPAGATDSQSKEAVAEFPPETPPPTQSTEKPAPVGVTAAVSPPLAPAAQSAAPPEQIGDPMAAAERAEVADAEKEREEREFWAIYLSGNGIFAFGLNSSHEWKENCPSVPEMSWTPDCAVTKPLGLAVEGRLGVRLGMFGLEGFLLGAADWTSARLEGEQLPIDLPVFAQGMQIGRVGGAIGGTVRIMTPPARAQISAGIGGGVMLRHVFTSVSSLDGSSKGYTAPMMRADFTFTVFKFLNLGVMGWVEFSKDVVISPDLSDAPGLPADELDPYLDALGDVAVFRGSQFFIGPFGGFAFGG